ncbi:MAG: histidinol dehydrogenase [Armatimonadota bacterium]
MRSINTADATPQAVRNFLARPLAQHHPEVEQRVKEIVQLVHDRGDAALKELTAKFDGAVLDDLRVSEQEFDDEIASLPEEALAAIRVAAQRIRSFHMKHRRETWIDFQPGEAMGQMIIPLRSAGLYVPGGLAAYPSSVLMCAIPAKVAGVKRLVMCSPCGPDGKLPALVLAAAREAGIDTIYKIGGAQAIAAMAYGTETIMAVDKIAGPGNLYVTYAKKLLYGVVGIDMLAGPSEVGIVADDTANPKFVALDLLSQAEHDSHTAAFLITPSQQMADAVVAAIAAIAPTLPRHEILAQTLAENGGVVVTRDMAEAVEYANECAPEHLALMVADPWSLLPQITCAGAVLLGHYAPQSLGDYVAGPSHTLPTAGTARFSSPLNVDDFVKKTSVISFTKEALLPLIGTIETLAELEHLEAHKIAASIRREE